MSALTCPSCGRGSPAEAAFCSGCGAKLGPTAAARESRKVVTTLFCDLVGSTSLGERHDPEVLRPLLEGYFAEAREAVERHGGRVEKFIGDAVCAVFGVPAVHEDDALRAVRAGLEIQDRLARLREGSPIPLEARVGITTGQVLVSAGGGLVIGDAMNTASRLQSGAEPGQVFIGAPTWRLVRDAVAAEPAPPLAAKGKAEPVAAWRILALVPGSPARARRLDAPMVGRDREAARLAGAYRRVAEARACRLFTVLGVAGAGKSRLVEEFLGSLRDTAEVLRGRCLSYGEGVTWLALVEALRPALGLAEFAGPDDVAAAVRAAAAGEGPDVAAAAAGLGGLFGLPGSGSAEQTAWAVRRLLEARARERPVVLVLDDVHWAEPALLDLVEHLAERADGPLLLLCMARPELLDARPGWGAGAGPADAVHLAPLAPADADALVGALIGGAALPADARERVTSAAGGNPLFLEEILRMLVDEGRLAREGDAWVVAGDLSGLRIPPTVSALLSSRLDRLPEGERSVLEAASVEGQSFSAGALGALVPEASRDALPGLLRSLARKDLVVPERRSGAGRDGYRFRHLLIRDAAYEAIPKSSRARLHLAFADWLEAEAGDALAEHREVLGHHLAQAYRYREELGVPDDPDLRLRAARALAEAGARAYDELGDARSAVRLLEIAVDLAPATEEAALWDERLWNIGFVVLGRPADSRPRDLNREVYGDEVADAVAARDARLRRQFADPSTIDRAVGRPDDLRALELYRAHGARHLEPGVLLRLSQGDYHAGDPEGAEAWAREALRSAEELGWRDVVQWAAGDLLNALFAGPSPLSRLAAEAAALVDRWAGRLASRPALWVHAEARALMGDAPGARADLDEAARLRAALGLPADSDELWAEPSVVLGTGDLRAVAGACRAALAQLPDGDRMNRNFMLGMYARVLLDLGHDEEAQVAVEPLERSAIVEQCATHRSLRARLLARGGDIDAALASIDEAAALAAPTGLAIVKADVALDRAHVLLAAGRVEDARASAEDALGRYRTKEHEVGARRAVAMLDALTHPR
jgi:class 3 adenylate cyclase/tetratricopeptide (TPR) repeat protein